MRLTVTIEATGAAFDDNPAPELARILRELADRIEPQEAGTLPGWLPILRDLNGNRCGVAAFVREDRP